MNITTKHLLFTILIFISFACSNTNSTSTAPENLANQVTIFRDTYGIPHINGQTDESVLFGLAYTQAEDHFDRIETQLIRSIGRLAEVEGESGKANDIRVKAFEIERISKEAYKSLDPKIKKLLRLYAILVNLTFNRKNANFIYLTD